MADIAGVVVVGGVLFAVRKVLVLPAEIVVVCRWLIWVMWGLWVEMVFWVIVRVVLRFSCSSFLGFVYRFECALDEVNLSSFW